MWLRRICLLLALVTLQVCQANAQTCNFAISNINFGNLNLGLGGTAPTSGTLSAQCTGIPKATLTICPNIGDGTGGSNGGTPRLMKQGTSAVPYDLYQSNGQIWGSYVWPYAPRPPVFSVPLDASGNGSLNQIIDARITGLASTSLPGTYVSNYSFGHTLIDYGYAPGQSCSVISARAARPVFSVSAQNNASCNVSATTLNFGTVSSLGVQQTATNQIAITCTNGVRYSIGLGFGSNGGTSAVNRLMLNGATGQKLTYALYQNASQTLPWGMTAGSDMAAGSATGLTQTFPAYGVIPTQPMPASGNYADTVVVTVNY